MFEAIARGRRFPCRHTCDETLDRSPVRLCLEQNCVNWNELEKRLQQSGVPWCSIDHLQDTIPAGDAIPAVCVEAAASRNQKMKSTATFERSFSRRSNQARMAL